MSDPAAVASPVNTTQPSVIAVPTAIFPSLVVAQLTNMCEVLNEDNYDCENKIETIRLLPFQPTAADSGNAANYCTPYTQNPVISASSGAPGSVGYMAANRIAVDNALAMTDDYFKKILTSYGKIIPTSFTYANQVRIPCFDLNSYHIANGLDNLTQFSLRNELIKAITHKRNCSVSDLSATDMIDLNKLAVRCVNLTGINGKSYGLTYDEVISSLIANGDIRKYTGQYTTRGSDDNQGFVNIIIHLDIYHKASDTTLHIALTQLVAFLKYVNVYV